LSPLAAAMPDAPALPSVSIIVPVYRDTPALAALLARLHRLAPDCQLLVVDAGADADCEVLCRSQGALWIPSQPCRGAQLNQGASVASGDVLWFLHADALPAPGALAALRGAVVAGAVGGAFRFSLPGARGLAARLIELGTALRIRLGGMVYGDQGLFATREAFFACGGFAEAGLFEEVPLVRALRRRGHFAVLRLPIGVSPRRWQRDGWWRRTWHNRKLALAFACGVPAEKLAGRYFHRSDPDDLTTGT
jgi:rSAM/selenodomain-associated transferase 2